MAPATEGLGSTLFVYGSLQSEEVLQSLLRRVPRSSACRLRRYQRFRVAGRDYPGIIISASAASSADEPVVDGRALFGLLDEEVCMVSLPPHTLSPPQTHTWAATSRSLESRLGLQNPSIPSPIADSTDAWTLFFSLSPSCFHQLDAFEGDEYEKTPVTVELAGDEGQELRTEAYVYAGASPTSQRWDYGEFRRDHLATFLAMCDEWQREYRGEAPFQDDGRQGIGGHIGKREES